MSIEGNVHSDITTFVTENTLVNDNIYIYHMIYQINIYMGYLVLNSIGPKMEVEIV